MEKGDILVAKIELFRLEHRRLPNSVREIGLEEKDGVDELYYQKEDSINYIVHFGTTLGESIVYYSDKKQWMERGKVLK